MKVLEELEQLFVGEFLEKKTKYDYDVHEYVETGEMRKHNMKLDFEKALSGNRAAGTRFRVALRLVETKAKLMRQMLSPKNMEDPSDELKQQIREYKLDKALEE